MDSIDGAERGPRTKPGLPDRPPFALRGRLLSPLADGTWVDLPDGLVEVDSSGRIARVAPWVEAPDGAEPGLLLPVHDLRPWILLPGLVDLHTHIPQLPNAGLGFGLDLLAWLDRYTLPLERSFDRAAAERLAPLAFRSMAAAGTTTVAAYTTADPAATDAVFAAAEAHGIRAIVGTVLMDRLPAGIGSDRPMPRAEAILRDADALCARWHGRDGGRISFAFTPRFAPTCTAALLAGSARMAADRGAYWQTHLSEDSRELAEVRRLFPEARDYVDVYDRAGGLRPQTILAHAVHLSQREVGRLVESGAGVAHCPSSNLFLPSGIMPLARYLEAGVRVGLGSDVSGGPGFSLFETMRVGAFSQHALITASGDAGPALDPLGWLTLGTLGGARVLGLDDRIGSVEAGKEADLVAVDPAATAPVPGTRATEPAEIVSRLIFRTDPGMVRGAWVRGRLLPA